MMYIALFQPNNTVPIIQPIGTPPTPVSVLYRCQSNSDCQSNKVCDGNLGVCVNDNGETCQSATDCLSTSYCSGICLARTVASNYNSPNPVPGQPCPCRDGYSCVTRGGVESQCYRSDNSPCEVNADCVSGLCVFTPSLGFPICSPTKPVGGACTANSECTSNNCSGGACQSQSVQSGQLGAWCGNTGAGTIGCNPGLACSSTGVCTDNVNNFEGGCNGGSGCSGLYTCYAIPPFGTIPGCTQFSSTSNLRECEGGTDFCQCLFNYDTSVNHVYPQPNLLSDSTKVCSSSFIKSGERCIGESGNFCSTGTDCFSGTCSSILSERNIPGVLQGNVVVENLFSGNETRTYPVTGLNNMENIIYTPLVRGTLSNPIIRIFGYTSNYRISRVPGVNYPEETETLYTLTSGGAVSVYNSATQTNTLMVFAFNDARYTLDKIVDGDSTMVSQPDNTQIPLTILVLAVTSTTNGSKSLVMATFNVIGSTYYLVVYGTWIVPIPDFTNTSTLVRLTLTSTVGYSDSLIVIRNGTLTPAVYLNGMLITTQLPSTTVWSSVTLNHGLLSDVDGVVRQSYRHIMYINTITPGIESYLTFTGPVDGTLISGSGYTTVRYPSTQFVRPDECSDPYQYNTFGFGCCNVDPLVTGYSNIVLSASLRDGVVSLSPAIYYINNSLESVIPGYPNTSCQFLMTSGQFYVYSNQTCL